MRKTGVIRHFTTCDRAQNTAAMEPAGRSMKVSVRIVDVIIGANSYHAHL